MRERDSKTQQAQQALGRGQSTDIVRQCYKSTKGAPQRGTRFNSRERRRLEVPAGPRERVEHRHREAMPEKH
ncbi:hypothetical protein NDU88_001355 [Pleurodeles waltl]|uniref:Uncharacterized protein n=1 Tax=Pleurodeles waltl TaxID=8319 RepID=A0AAV7NCC7_PLEWA|nr:hypothetical protein NDU88_001355 [Pleurodeles waltl]